MKPELKQFGDLTQEDFERYPVWVNVHTIDYEESWYDETDEETFRPWDSELPVDPSSGMFLVRSRFVLADSANFIGFITPTFGTGDIIANDLATVQPCLFNKNGIRISFWGGMPGFTDEAKKSIYKSLERTSNQVFPIQFSAEGGLTEGKQSGEIRGFCKLTDFASRAVEVTV